MSEITRIDLDKLEISPYNVRDVERLERDRKERKRIEELAKSISAQGLIHPIVVRKSRKDPEKYEIIVGARRYKALKLLRDRGELPKELEGGIPARIIEVDDERALLMSLTENIQMRTITEEEKRRAIERLHVEFGMTDSEVEKSLADLVGLPLTEVRNILSAMSALRELEGRGVKTVLRGEPGRWGEIRGRPVSEILEESKKRISAPEVPSRPTPELMVTLSKFTTARIGGLVRALSRYPEFSGRDRYLSKLLQLELGNLKEMQLIEATKYLKREYRKLRKEHNFDEKPDFDRAYQLLQRVAREATKISIGIAHLSVRVPSDVKQELDSIAEKYKLSLHEVVSTALKILLKRREFRTLLEKELKKKK